MIAVVQRCSRGEVRVQGDRVGALGERGGLVVLLGVEVGDGEAEAHKMADKVAKLRIFEDDEGRLGAPLGDREILCVSQFTLLADLTRGNRPGFEQAARPEDAEPLYDLVCERLGAKTGVFGADMAIDLVCRGPVTILLDT